MTGRPPMPRSLRDAASSARRRGFRRAGSPARLFWWCWLVASAVWIAVALMLFPQRWQDDSFWAALLASDSRVLTAERCGHVLDTEVARGCRQIERMAREREQNRREDELLGAFSSLATVFGPPLAVLFGAFLTTILFADRFGRRPPSARPPGSGPNANDISLPPTTYVPPHLRHPDAS